MNFPFSRKDQPDKNNAEKEELAGKTKEVSESDIIDELETIEGENEDALAPEDDDENTTLPDAPGIAGPLPEGHRHAGHAVKGSAAVLTLAALGVVFGDIGTSPLYAMHAIFSPEAANPIAVSEQSVFGVISLIVWSVTIIVSLKYILLIMRADNHGEGGIMALIALMQKSTDTAGNYGIKRRAMKGRKVALVALGVFGASLFYGDGMITPAISVLSSVEGLEVVSPDLESFVVPIALAILTFLFAVQRFGTGLVGKLFGPVMMVWFTVLAVLGIMQIVKDPSIVKALSPHYAFEFFFAHPVLAFLALGSVVLAVTGAEALYADMGHFGRGAISRAWFFMVFPALTLNYLGQARLVLDDPSAIGNPFFLMVPESLRLPMVFLAMIATIIASQAVISGAFSVSRQAVQLGFLPRLHVRYPSGQEGQAYVPKINWALYVSVVLLVVGFQSSAHLASAYGIAVTGTLAIDTILFFVVVRTLWKSSLKVAIGGAAVFLFVDLAFFFANVPKIMHGGWFPLLIGAIIFVTLMTWQKGRVLVTERRIEAEGDLAEFVEQVHNGSIKLSPTEGTAIFLNRGKKQVPLAMRANARHNRVRHENVVILSVDSARVPQVVEEKRVVVDDLIYDDDHFWHIALRFGFQDDPNIPDALRIAHENGRLPFEFDESTVSYFISQMDLERTNRPGMSSWRKRLFMMLMSNTANPMDYFDLPRDQTLTLGAKVEL